ncbi:YolD-like family protein [Metabacillus idriensis]|uniref:YolD-like family protein n=1 Tax=Metabacillus idriensis TaxID=324768 RepID=UPI001749B533|nr:YolD-like family protein [Metabacillus idriensis]
MPEHFKPLIDVQMDYQRVPKPHLDEGQIEDLEKLLSDSLKENILLEIPHGRTAFSLQESEQ